MATAASTSLEAKSFKEVDKHIPRVIQLVMTMSSESATSTIAEHRVDRFFLWMQFLLMPFMFIGSAVVCTYDLRDKVTEGVGFPWWLLVIILLAIYLALVQLALGHLGLFLPQTPYAAWDVLNNVGFKEMIFPMCINCTAALLFDQAWLLITFACLLGILVAAVLSYWVSLVRTFGPVVN